MLSQLIKKDYIQLDMEVNNFEEAIRISMEPLLLGGQVTSDYVEEIIKIYQDIGPYIVITPQIALPHAPSEKGAEKLAIGFTRLKEPVISGNRSNDPVKYFFPLSAPDNESHIQVLSQLAELLSDVEFIEVLSNIQDNRELIDYLKTREEA